MFHFSFIWMSSTRHYRTGISSHRQLHTPSIHNPLRSTFKLEKYQYVQLQSPEKIGSIYKHHQSIANNMLLKSCYRQHKLLYPLTGMLVWKRKPASLHFKTVWSRSNEEASFSRKNTIVNVNKEKTNHLFKYVIIPYKNHNLKKSNITQKQWLSHVYANPLSPQK